MMVLSFLWVFGLFSDFLVKLDDVCKFCDVIVPSTLNVFMQKRYECKFNFHLKKLQIYFFEWLHKNSISPQSVFAPVFMQKRFPVLKLIQILNM
jgi:hypothetical protein